MIYSTGIGITGAATIDPLYSSASITVAGSNNPHGVVQFGANSLNVRVNEDSGKIYITIDRKFGAIGSVLYSILYIFYTFVDPLLENK